MKTDKNGFVTEDGLVALYRDFGHLGDDVEAGGVSWHAMWTNFFGVWGYCGVRSMLFEVFAAYVCATVSPRGLKGGREGD